MKLPAILGLTTLIVYLGKVQEGGIFHGRIILAGTILFIMLSALESVNSPIAIGLATLILIGAVYSYAPKLLKAAL